MSDIESVTPSSEFVINIKKSQSRSLVSIVSVGLAVSGVALLVSTTSGKSLSVQNDASVSALNVVDRRVTRSGSNDFERNLASSPTKSPSSGLHKPTWKPSSKPVEHAASKTTVGAALPKHRELGLKPVAAQKSSNSDGVTETTSTTTTSLTSANTVSNSKTAIAESMPVGGLGPITPEGAPSGPQAPILSGTPVAMAMTAPWTLYVPEAVEGSKSLSLPAMNLPPSPDAPEKADVLVSESAAVPEVAEVAATIVTVPEVTTSATTSVVSQPIPKISSPNARGDPRNSPTVTSLRTTGGSVTTKKSLSKEKDSEETTKSDSSKKVLKSELKTMKSELKSAKAVVEKVEDALPNASSKKEKKEIKAEIKDAIKTVVSKKEEIAAVEAVVDGEDVVKEVTTKTVYSQDADYFKKEEKRASRKAYKKAMERADAALEAMKEDVSGADADADASDSSKSNKKKVKTSTTVEDETEVEEVVFKSSKSDSEKSSSKKSKSSTSSSKKSSKDDRRHLTMVAADPCHDGLSPRCTPPTSKPVEHRSLAGSPTKSPSSGLHKPTWRPSSKPAEHRSLKSAAQKAAKEAAGTHYYEIKAKTTKAVPDSGLNSEVSTESDAEVAETEPVEVSLDADFEKKEDKRESRKADKKAREEAESTGATVHTWNGETRRGLAGTPTKSPSSGLHKPTWRPSSKPVEHASKSSIGAALPRSSRRQLSLKDKKEELKTFQAAALASEEKESSTSSTFSSESDVDAQSFTAKFSSSSTSSKSERESKKADAKLKAKVVEEESKKASKGEDKQANEKALSLKATELKGDLKSSELKTAAKEASKSGAKDEVDFELNEVTGEQKKMTKWLAEAYESSGHRLLSKADKEAANDAKHGSDKLSKKESKKIIEKKADQLEDKKSQLKKVALSTNKDKVSSRQLKIDQSTSKISILPKTGADPTKSPSSGLHKPTWRPSSKPIEHNKGDSEPSKSPSSGVHKPTWKPSSKPVEQSSKKSSVGAALPRQL